MKKILVETTGQFQLISPATGQGIHAHRPSVVAAEPFFNQRTLIGQIKVVASDLLPTATDKEFGEFWKESEGDRELAIDSFRAKFDPTHSSFQAESGEDKDKAPRGKKPA